MRDKSVEGFIRIAKGAEKGEINTTILPFVVKLSNSIQFGTKMSSLGIITELY